MGCTECCFGVGLSSFDAYPQSIAGASLVGLATQTKNSDDTPLGDVFALLSAMMYGFYGVLIEKRIGSKTVSMVKLMGRFSQPQ